MFFALMTLSAVAQASSAPDVLATPHDATCRGEPVWDVSEADDVETEVTFLQKDLSFSTLKAASNAQKKANERTVESTATVAETVAKPEQKVEKQPEIAAVAEPVAQPQPNVEIVAKPAAMLQAAENDKQKAGERAVESTATVADLSNIPPTPVSIAESVEQPQRKVETVSKPQDALSKASMTSRWQAFLNHIAKFTPREPEAPRFHSRAGSAHRGGHSLGGAMNVAAVDSPHHDSHNKHPHARAMNDGEGAPHLAKSEGELLLGSRW